MFLARDPQGRPQRVQPWAVGGDGVAVGENMVLRNPLKKPPAAPPQRGMALLPLCEKMAKSDIVRENISRQKIKMLPSPASRDRSQSIHTTDNSCLTGIKNTRFQGLV